MWALRPGDRVKTRWGTATVEKCFGSQVLVALESGVKVRLSRTELAPKDSTRRAEPPPSERRRGLKDARISRLKAIEALRFGLVPEEYIEELTIGFSSLKDWVLRRLPYAHNGRPQVSEITGPFGTGKSHTMAVIRYVARNEGYVTARV